MYLTIFVTDVSLKQVLSSIKLLSEHLKKDGWIPINGISVSDNEDGFSARKVFKK